MEQILLEAQERWLRPPEISEILRNYKSFRIAPEAPNRPRSGSLFLFDRKALRYFRRDGHNWRKKKDGKTVKEAHERLKVGSVDMLHCYYAHGEDRENFQRRSYWLLEEDYTHIVLVHYLEVQNTKTSFCRQKDAEETSPTTATDNPFSSNSFYSSYPLHSQITDADSMGSVPASESENLEPDNYQASSRYHPCPESHVLEKPAADASQLKPYFPVPYSTGQGCYPELSSGWNYLSAKALNGRGNAFEFDLSDRITTSSPTVDSSTNLCPVEESFECESSWFSDDLKDGVLASSAVDVTSQVPCILPVGSSKHSLRKHLSLDIADIENDSGLRKCDSFSKWMSKELEEVDGAQFQMSSAHYWLQVEAGNPPESDDMFLLCPSPPQDQLFSIVDFSPQWAYSGQQTQVLVTGLFLKNKADVAKCDWSCMFGEVEVPAHVVSDGVLGCLSPAHNPGRVHFYVTCSNRLACSEIREFEYKNIPDSVCGSALDLLLSRLEKLLSIDMEPGQMRAPGLSGAKLHQTQKVNFLLQVNREDPESQLLKQKLWDWLLRKIAEDGKGPCVLDEDGLGAIHLASALGYDWAIPPIVSAGVSVDFRDSRGWTALHWAASRGEERTVVALFSLHASPGALTDPTLEFPGGRTPADLASASGHKGIAGFLAESALTRHLSILTLKDPGGVEEFEDVERVATRAVDENMAAGLSAIRRAAQAAARIHQVFRVDSFRRNRDGDLPLVTVKSNKSSQREGEPVVAAAVRIQNKFRGWKGRREFLVTRQRIIKIQAHVRGHLVRKRAGGAILWTVGIVEKVILRWRRKGNGLRGFRSTEMLMDGERVDCDVLREGRKQVTAGLEKALARVKSMVQYPEARDQYCRLLTVAEELTSQSGDSGLLEGGLNDPDTVL
ncbi:calmodulin-binding transcription activator 3-like isoform X2 [Wolffia australiana]